MKEYIKKTKYLRHLLVWIRYLIHRYLKDKQFKRTYIAKNFQLEVVDKNEVDFFGYYNISPENYQGDIIYLKVCKEEIRGSLSEPAAIMLKDRAGIVTKIAETKSWNWQQGCMLQWMPGSNEKIIFNDYDAVSSQYISKIIDKEGNIIQELELPVYSISKTGDYALSLNFSRLAAMRPDYGYFNIDYDELLEDDKDGIWYIDLKTSKTYLLLTLNQLKDLSYVETMEGAQHKVNHIDIAPDGQTFMFLHRWKGPQGRFMRLMTCNKDGNDLRILNGDIMTSHCCWLNSSEILAFCNYQGSVGYYKFNIHIKEAGLYSDLFPKIDGHPSISPDGKYVITDSYPNLSRFSSLYLYDIQKQEMKIAAKFYQPTIFKGEKRVDLHPKWGKDSHSIFLESGHNRTRRLWFLTF